MYKIYNNYININNINKNKLLFGFDLDGTLIKYNLKSSDFEYQYNNVIDKLKKISKIYNIIIITNQAHNKFDIFEKKINKLCDELKLNNLFVHIFVSLKNDLYRKPNTKICDIIENIYNNKLKYYCGDALGRKNDHSDTDLKFGINLCINIFSPEYIFKNENQNKFISLTYPKLNIENYNFVYNVKPKEMIIMVGMPGCGKSYISQYIQDKGFINNIYYKIINRDKLKTINKCIKETLIGLKYRMNIIIDNTNPNKASRKIFIDIGKKYNYNIILIEFDTPIELCKHNNYYRAYKYNQQIVPDIVYNIFKSKYEKPNINENITKIIKINKLNIYDINYYRYFF